MSEGTPIIRLSKAASEFNVGVTTIIDYLHRKGIKIDSNPNTKLTPEMYSLLVKEYQPDKAAKEISKKKELEFPGHTSLSIDNRKHVSEDNEENEGSEIMIKTSGLQSKLAPEKTAPVQPPKAPVTEHPVIPVPKPEPVVQPVVSAEPVAAPVVKAEPAVQHDGKPEPAPVVPATEQKPEPAKEDAIVEHPAEEPAKAGTGEARVTGTVSDTAQSGPVVLGKIDLSQFAARKQDKKGREKEKGKEKAVQPESIPAADVTADADHAVIPEPAPEPAPEVVAAAAVPQPEAAVTGIPSVEPEAVQPETVQSESVSMPGVYSKDDANFVPTKVRNLEGPKILGKIELKDQTRTDNRKPVATSGPEAARDKKKKRKRIKKTATPVVNAPTPPADQRPKPGERPKQRRDTRRPIEPKVELTEEEIQKQIRETLQRLSGTGKSKASKYRREKRHAASQQMEVEQARLEEEKSILKVTEFVTANDLASMMNVPVVQIIATCMSVGVFVSINQRLDAETISLLADEFGYKVEFVSVEVQEAIDHEDIADNPEDLVHRPPIVTVMGHVDHGKTSLLDYIRNTNVIGGEAGGITQHIGAYEVKLSDGRRITFLDTPGHEAFTAMRARGAKVTDIVIIVIAADDTVMPQTKEAINHAQAAGSPMVFAINKIDKAGANPEKIKEELSKLNILVEDWGGKYQSQEISAKKGINVEELLEKVLLEAEMLDLKGNPSRKAAGTVIESSLDKGRGYVAKLLIQTGTLHMGDILVAGSIYGKVKAMYNERNQVIKEAGPSSPVLLLGLTGAPQAGDMFNVMNDEREAKQIATKRQQLQREQGIRTQKHITLDEIGRRIAIGDFKELNLIVKGDVDGSVEALSDSMLKLSTEQVQVNVIHKSVGAITESDVLLASASNAIIVGFQVRPSMSARKLAEREEIDIRLYSIIYNAINEIKAAIEGMLSPEIEEKITCNVEVREVFHITKVGTIAGCMVLDGKINRHTRVRIIRDGIVVHTGSLGSLKRFKDDAKEVATGYECGLNIDNYNDIRIGDIIEGFEEVEVKRKL